MSPDARCPLCSHRRLDHKSTHPPIFECQNCGERVHQAVADMVDDLEILAERDDKIGAYAGRLLETGGVA